MLKINRVQGSFRDPSGFVYKRNGEVYRQVNACYMEEYDQLMKSGLYEELVAKRFMVDHRTQYENPGEIDALTIKPKTIEFISYPYEWCFSQLRDAALLTLKIQKLALKHGMILKDASAYNIQFDYGRPIFIDTLSFARYQIGQPWVAYKQFCQHFLAPLLLMSRVDTRLNQLLKVYIDGIPLDLASSLLPVESRLSPSELMHLHWHAKVQTKYSDRPKKVKGVKVSKNGLLGLVDSLEKKILKLRLREAATEWGDYYSNTNYSDKSFDAKAEILTSLLSKHNLSTKLVLDLGANTGVFSRKLVREGDLVVAADIDHMAVELNYRQVKDCSETNVLPLLMDLSNPSPGIGWGNVERDSFLNRNQYDLVVSLALIHHLAISYQIPMSSITEFYSRLAPVLLIEFVPKSDTQVMRLLASREDIFDDYNQNSFEESFLKCFELLAKEKIPGSERTLYLLKNRQNR